MEYLATKHDILAATTNYNRVPSSDYRISAASNHILCRSGRGRRRWNLHHHHRPSHRKPAVQWILLYSLRDWAGSANHRRGRLRNRSGVASGSERWSRRCSDGKVAVTRASCPFVGLARIVREVMKFCCDMSPNAFLRAMNHELCTFNGQEVSYLIFKKILLRTSPSSILLLVLRHTN